MSYPAPYTNLEYIQNHTDVSKEAYIDLLLEVVVTKIEVCKSAWHKLVEGESMSELVHPFGRQATVRQV
jgi:hypothetical protein